MLKRFSLATAGALLFAAAPAAAQDLQPQTRTVLHPVTPPAAVVTPMGPNSFQVTPVPGVAVATTVKIQNFADYDLNRDGLYAPSEFAQALYFLATGDPALGNPALPRTDRTMHKGAPLPINPKLAVALLNATSDEFTRTDMNRDARISPAELQAVSLM